MGVVYVWNLADDSSHDSAFRPSALVCSEWELIINRWHVEHGVAGGQIYSSTRSAAKEERSSLVAGGEIVHHIPDLFMMNFHMSARSDGKDCSMQV